MKDRLFRFRRKLVSSEKSNQLGCQASNKKDEDQQWSYFKFSLLHFFGEETIDQDEH